MVKINRRQFLAFAAGASSAIFASCTRGQANHTQGASNSSLDFPQVYQSRDGLLELDLEASKRPLSLGRKQAYLLTYNGQVPAPRLEANPGDRVRVHFTNNLFQPTNLH